MIISMLIVLSFLLTSLQIDHLGSYFIQGLYRDAKIDAQHIYFCTGRGFEIYDYSDPQLVGCAATDGLATGVDVAGNYIYIADQYNGLCIFDISDPSNPIFTGHYDTGGFTEYVVVKDSIAYLADGDSGLVILNVSDPSNPGYLGGWTQSNYYAVTVFVADTIAYLGNILGDPLKIINVANPSNPFLIANFPQNPGGGVIVSACVVDTFAFLAGSWGIADDLYHFLIANVSDPANPVFLSGLEFDQASIKVVVEGNYAYVNNQSDGIRIIDISNPEQPIEVSCFNEAIAYGYGPAVYDSIMVTPELNEEGFSIVNVADPTHPIKLCHHPSVKWTSFALDNDLRHLYLLGILRTTLEMVHITIEFIDINDITNPLIQSALNFLGGWDVSYHGPGLAIDHPYVAFGLKRESPISYFLGVIDISDISSPQLMRFETGALGGPLTMISPYVYAGHYSKLMIGDIFSDVFWIDSLYTETRCYGAVINDSIAYTACLDNLTILNLNSGALLATYYHNHENAGQSGSILFNYPYLFMSYDEYTAGHGFLIFNVSTPQMPTLLIDTILTDPITPYSYVGHAEGSYLKDTLFFLCRGYYGFDIWNVVNPTMPMRVLTQETPSSCDRIHMIGDTIIVMDETSIEVYCMTDVGVSEEYSSDIVGRGSFIDVMPNPFREKTVIKYRIAHGAEGQEEHVTGATLKIYDVSGKVVKSFALSSHTPSSDRVEGLGFPLSSSITWDGTDDRGHTLAQGVYFITVETADESHTTKAILLK
jgi:hypothetical protein